MTRTILYCTDTYLAILRNIPASWLFFMFTEQALLTMLEVELYVIFSEGHTYCFTLLTFGLRQTYVSAVAPELAVIHPAAVKAVLFPTHDSREHTVLSHCWHLKGVTATMGFDTHQYAHATAGGGVEQLLAIAKE